MENVKVQFAEVQSATYRADNSNDADRTYDVSGSVKVDGSRVSSIDAGIVTEGAVQVATFRVGNNYSPAMPATTSGRGVLSVDFYGEDNLPAITAAVVSFIAGVKALAAGNSQEGGEA